MADELPDDWFRPRKDEDAASPAPESASPGDAPHDEDQHSTLSHAARDDDDEPGDDQTSREQQGAETPASHPEVSDPEGSGPPEGRAGTDSFLISARPGHPHPLDAVTVSPDGATVTAPRSTADNRPGVIPVVTPAPPTIETTTSNTSWTTGLQPRVRRPSWLGRHPWWATLLAVASAMAVGVSTGQLLRERTDGVLPAPTSSQSTSGAVSVTPSATTVGSPTPPPQPWEGPTTVLTASGVRATCTAPPANDAAGVMVGYEAENVLDDDPSTAWRCNGDGEGEELTFTFPAGSTLVGVGVVNGYAKVSAGEQLYEQYRRVLAVEWRMPDGSWFSQSLADNTTGVQQVSIPPITVEGPVVMTVVTTSDPGQAGVATRDAVLVSQVQFLAKV